MQNPGKPLAGLTVLSLEQAVTAPYCSMRLADAGARVIKIERPEGDFARFYDRAAGGLASYFVWLNRGKQSLVADIKQPEDAALLHRILARTDIFIQNLAPGAAARAGFGSAELRARHPRLITLDISGYGENNAYAEMKAYDMLVQAECGLASISGHPAGPGRVGVSVCDITCGLTAYSGVLEALIARSISGQGQSVSVSLFDAMADWMTVPLLHYEASGTSPPRIGLAHPSICPYGAFALQDGTPVLIAIQNEREWVSFCRTVLHHPELATQEGLASNNDRVAHRAAVDHHVASTLSTLDRAEAVSRFKAAETAFAFVNDMQGLAHHPALRRMAIATPNGDVSLVAPPIRGPIDAQLGPVPEIGSHSHTLRQEFAG